MTKLKYLLIGLLFAWLPGYGEESQPMPHSDPYESFEKVPENDDTSPPENSPYKSLSEIPPDV